MNTLSFISRDTKSDLSFFLNALPGSFSYYKSILKRYPPSYPIEPGNYLSLSAHIIRSFTTSTLKHP